MITNPNKLALYPRIMNKEQFREACHISKRKARWLLELGLVPCKKTGKKTRCYIIKKTDVIIFVKDYLNDPAKYNMPSSVDTRPNKSPGSASAIKTFPATRSESFTPNFTKMNPKYCFQTAFQSLPDTLFQQFAAGSEEEFSSLMPSSETHECTTRTISSISWLLTITILFSKNQRFTERVLKTSKENIHRSFDLYIKKQ